MKLTHAVTHSYDQVKTLLIYFHFLLEAGTLIYFKIKRKQNGT